MAALIDATRTASQQVFVYGVSYGTYWAQRYLQVRPDQPTAVILDSTIPAVGFDNAVFDKQFDDSAHAILSLCSADATCSVKLGSDPLAKAVQALAAVDGGQCKVPGYDIRQTFGQLVSGVFFYYEPLLLPAAVYRILRCNAADQTWLSRVSAFAVSGWSGSTYPMQPGSDVVLYNIVLSELWLDTRTPSDFQAQEKTMVAYDGWPATAAALAPLWPKYPHDSYYGSWPSSPAAILVLQVTATGAPTASSSSRSRPAHSSQIHQTHQSATATAASRPPWPSAATTKAPLVGQPAGLVARPRRHHRPVGESLMPLRWRRLSPSTTGTSTYEWPRMHGTPGTSRGTSRRAVAYWSTDC